jgi:hypothetical protein
MRTVTLASVLAVLALHAAGCVIHAVPPAPAGGGEHAWVCHGKKGTWKRVGRPAVEAHAKHGDRVSLSPQPVGAPCD